MKPLLPTAGLLALLALGAATNQGGAGALSEGALAPAGVVVPLEPESGAAPVEGKGSLALLVRGDVIPHPVFALFVLPGETVPITLASPSGEVGPVEIEAPAGALRAEGPLAWTWTAPKSPGLHRLRLVEPATGKSTTLNAFVLHRMEPGAESVGGYRIGTYPPPLGGRADRYSAPRGYVEVTAENRDVLVAPHFTLGQFVCKQGTGWPKFVVLREGLLLKLEALLEAANRRGWKGKTFHVMSGYRTPSYNKGLGNVGASRHLYGDAADVFLDDDGDGNMDDLNRDGKVDRADAVALHDLFSEVEGTSPMKPYLGGLGIYPANAAHGPFVHVDARGSQARWGE